MTLPAHYREWLSTALGEPLPVEATATCGDCVMLTADPSRGLAFHPSTKCCTYTPALPNFTVGALLASDSPDLEPGRRYVGERIARGDGVDALGIRPPAGFSREYAELKRGGTFGRVPEMRCPMLTPTGACGMWSVRISVCSTWFCKYDRGATGERFWALVRDLLIEVERDLARWCAVQAGEPDAAEAVPFAPDGGVEAYFLAAHARVDALDWDDVRQIAGPRLAALDQQLRRALRELSHPTAPDRLRAAPLEEVAQLDGAVSVVSYSSFDPLELPQALFDVLRHFDGAPTPDILARVEADLGQPLPADILAMLIDFEVVRPA